MTALFDREGLRAALVARGVSQADALLDLAEPAVRLESVAASDAEIGVGGCKLGGWPDLPVGARWPEYGGRPQSFVAQLDLAALRPLSAAHALPASGLLSFFYDCDQRVWGSDPEDRGAWSVLYTPAASVLERAAFPAGLPPEAQFGCRRLVPRSEVTFAPVESSDVARLGLSDEEIDAYYETMPARDAFAHRLLGHADPIQNDMQLQAQLVFHAVDEDDDARTEELRAGATDWRLLLQIDSDEDAGMMWGDVGRLYYWIRRADLEQARFDDVWMIFQCC